MTLEEAYTRYGPALLRKAQRLLQSTQEAQDVVHALFVDMHARNETRLDLPLLFRATTNRCLNVLRDQKNRARLLEQHEPALRGIVRTKLDEHVIGLQWWQQLSGELDALDAELLVYKYYDDLSQEEMATLVGKSRKTVGKKLAALDETLRSFAAKHGGAT